SHASVLECLHHVLHVVPILGRLQGVLVKDLLVVQGHPGSEIKGRTKGLAVKREQISESLVVSATFLVPERAHVSGVTCIDNLLHQTTRPPGEKVWDFGRATRGPDRGLIGTSVGHFIGITGRTDSGCRSVS